MSRKKKPNATPVHTLPRVAPDLVHILAGRRVVSVPLPPRGPAGSEDNYARSYLVSAALRRLKTSLRFRELDRRAAPVDSSAAPRARRPKSSR